MPALPRPTGLIFDMDGVLILSERVHARAYETLFAGEGIEFDIEEFRRIGHGVPRRDVIQRVMGDVSPGRLERLMARKGKLVERELERGSLDAVPGALDFVAEMSSAGVRLAVATASTMPRPFLRSVGAVDLFDAIVTSADVAASKPAPDIFLAAAKLIETPSEECVVIEDSVIGIRGAKAAGMTVVGLTTTSDRSALSEADFICDGFAELCGLFSRSHVSKASEAPT